MPRVDKYMLTETYERSLRWFVSPFIFIYGAMKPWQFENAFANTSLPTNELEGMSLMWAFFGYSQTVPIVVGVFECTGALLFIFDRTKLFGVMLLLPVLSNIVLFDLVYQVAPIPTMNGIFYLAVVGFVLFRERKRLYQAAKHLLELDNTSLEKPTFSLRRIMVMVICLVINLVLFTLCHHPLGNWLLGS